MITFVVTVLDRAAGSYRYVDVVANSADDAKAKVIAGLTGSGTVYDVRHA